MRRTILKVTPISSGATNLQFAEQYGNVLSTINRWEDYRFSDLGQEHFYLQAYGSLFKTFVKN